MRAVSVCMFHWLRELLRIKIIRSQSVNRSTFQQVDFGFGSFGVITVGTTDSHDMCMVCWRTYVFETVFDRLWVNNWGHRENAAGLPAQLVEPSCLGTWWCGRGVLSQEIHRLTCSWWVTMSWVIGFKLRETMVQAGEIRVWISMISIWWFS